MDESEFNHKADEILTRIEAALEESGLDADLDLKPGGVLEIGFADGSTILINRHGAARQIWVAARSGGFHFGYADGVWRDTRDGGELFAALSRLVSAQSGAPVILPGR